LLAGTTFLCGCGSAPGPELKERQVSMTLTKSAPDLSGRVSSESLYYFSVYNWLRYQNSGKARAGALNSLSRAVKADPSSLYLRLELAELLLKLHKVDDALVHAEAALELDPNNQRARRLLAAIYTLGGDKDRAVKQYQKLIAENPDNSEALFYLVALYAETAEYEKALDLLKDYRQKHPDDVLAPFYQGKIYAELKLYTEAERYFKEALQIDPEMPDAWLSLGLIYEFTDRRKEAVEAYKTLLEINSDDRQALERLGQLLVSDGDLDAALKIFQRLKDRGDVPASINIKIALIYFQKGKYKEAAEILEELHRTYPDKYRITFYLASSLEALERQEEALKLFLSIPDSDELFYDARVHAAFLYEGRKEFKACEAVLDELIVKYPGKAGLYRMRAALHQKQDDDHGALEILKKALVQHPDDYKLRFALGVVYNDLGQTQESVAVMQGLLKENPDDATVLNFIGYTYVEQGIQLDDAEKLLKRALELKPDSGYILDSMGWLFYVRKDYEKALEYLLKAEKMIDNDPTLFEHLGDINLALERYDEALKNYRRSLKIKEDKNIRDKMEKLLQKVN
jgi:tetratricopeptide (TPR) repeat protein